MRRIRNAAKYSFIVLQKEKEKWIKTIPNANSRVSKETVVFVLHRPSRFEEIKVDGISRLNEPPPRYGQVYHLVKYRYHHTSTTHNKRLFKHTQH